MLHFLFILLCASLGSGMPDMVNQYKYIIGGKNTNISEVPYQAALRRDGNFLCGATIISERYLLSAAHCILKPSTYSVRVGSSYAEKDGVIHQVKKVVKHPLYPSEHYDYDVACLELEGKLEFNSNVQPIPIVDAEPRGGETVKISGYGKNSIFGYPEQLQSAESTMLAREKCKNKFPQLSPRMICTLSENSDKCPYKADSGGPIVVNGKVAGAVSWGILVNPCTYPTVYANFADPEIRKFIKENTGI